MNIKMIAQRDRYRRTDHGLQQRGIGRHTRLNFGRQILFEKTGMQVHQMIEYRTTQVCADALTDPRHEIKARIGAKGQQYHEQREDFERVPQHAWRAAREPRIDHHPHALADRKRHRRGDDQRERRADHLQAIRREIAQCGFEIPELTTRGAFFDDVQSCVCNLEGDSHYGMRVRHRVAGIAMVPIS